MKPIFSKCLFCILILTLAMFSACKVDQGDDDSENTGTLQIILSDAIPKGIAPALSMTPASYDITATSESGEIHEETLSGNSTRTSVELAPGQWTVSISALNDENIIIGSGSNTATVVSGSTASVYVLINESSGNGTITLQVSWPTADVADPGISCRLTATSGEVTPLNFTINAATGIASINGSTIPYGQYSLSLVMLDNGNPIAGQSDKVRVVQGQSTTGSYAFDNFDSFVTQWTTTNTGVSANNQIKLPLFEGGSYDFIVNWGDGEQDRITAWDAEEATHTYGLTGTYTVTITGWLRGFSFYKNFDNAASHYGDAEKLIDVTQWGSFDFGVDMNMSDTSDFAGSVNLTISASDTPVLTNAVSLANLFRDSTGMGLVANAADWDTTNIRSMAHMFKEVGNMAYDITGWSVSNVTDMESMFEGCNGFNQDISEWDVSRVTNMSSMFKGCVQFDQNISNWDVSSVTDMSSMFDNALNFEQNLGGWVVSNVESMDDMFENVMLSATNYGALLTGWAALSFLQDDVIFDGGTSTYLPGAPASAKLTLENDYNWTIYDGGEI